MTAPSPSVDEQPCGLLSPDDIAAVQVLVDAAPPLTAEQIERVRGRLRIAGVFAEPSDASGGQGRAAA
jgi:hypothetical protein